MIQIDDHVMSDSSTGLDAPSRAGQLVLRIRGTSRDGQILRLQSAKCTIGSDRRCTLRLNAPGIRPVHCLIVRGRQTTIVRRWSPDTRLNGSEFADAQLSPGDRLGIGPIEMEVVETTALPALPQSPKPKETSVSYGLRNITRRLNLANQQGRRRARRLVEELRRARQEIERLRGRVSQTADQADHCQAELDARWKQLRQEAERLEAQRTVLDEHRKHQEQRETELDEDRRQIDACRAELEVRQTEFEQRQQQWDRQCGEREQQQRESEQSPAFQASEAAASSDAARDELLAERAAFEEEKRQWEAEVQAHRLQWEQQQREFEQQRQRLAAKHQEVEARLTDWQLELDEQEARLEKQRQAVADREPSWPAAASEIMSAKPARAGQPAERAPHHPPEAAAPIAPRAVLPLPISGGESLPEASPQVAEEEVEAHRPQRATPGPVETAAAREADRVSEETKPGDVDQVDERKEKEDDESIDDYMARLLKRLNVMTTTEPKDSGEVRAPKPAAISRQAFLGANHPYRQKTEEEQKAENEEAAAKRAATRRHRPTLEGITTLAAMRELATGAASSAISAHARSQLKKTMRGKLFLSIAAMALGVSLIAGRLVWSFQNWQFYVGVAGLFLAILWVVQYAVLIGRLTVTRSGHLSWHKEEAEGPSEDGEPKEEDEEEKKSDEKDLRSTTPAS